MLPRAVQEWTLLAAMPVHRDVPGSPDARISRAQARELDRRAIEELGIPAIVLMENAGRAAALEALRILGPAPAVAAAVLVLCGPGNNGGDGLVVARTLTNRGVGAEVCFVGPRERFTALSSEFATNERLWRGLGGTIRFAEDDLGCAALAPDISRAALVVDALFGTGLTRGVESPWKRAIELVNDHARAVLALDLPSGLDADTGEVLGAAVRASTTVTFVAEKPGLRLAAGPGHAGFIVVAEIGVPRAWIPGRSS